MEHFSIVQALCRVALGTGSPAARRQVERLRDAARSADDDHAARSLEQLLSQASRTTDMAPSKLSQSKATVTGEEFTRNTAIPVDRETSSPLADVFFPETLPGLKPVFDDGLSRAAETIINEWRNAESLAAVGVEPTRSCLIYGAPGTGKTTLALWIAQQLGVPAVVARLDGLISSFLGTTARNVGSLFTFVNRYRCVLVLDEFDAVAKVRDDPHEVGEIKRVVNALLQNIDARRNVGITLAITNHEHLLDPAIWRRFEIQLQVPRPSAENRLEIIRRHLPPVEIGEPSEKLMAWFTEGLSGAETETMVKAFKRDLAVHGPATSGLVDKLQQLSILNQSRLQSDRVGLMAAEPHVIAQRLTTDGSLRFTQAEVGQVLDRDKATISRWLRANNKD